MNAVSKWKCRQCGGLHDDKAAAQVCCIPPVREVQVCEACGAEYKSVVDAGQCCHKLLWDGTKGKNFGSVV